MAVPLNVVGEVRNSAHAGHKLRVVDDTQSSGGYLIYEWWDGSNGPNPDNAFDSWVEAPEGVQGFIEESGYDIEWPLNFAIPPLGLKPAGV